MDIFLSTEVILMITTTITLSFDSLILIDNLTSRTYEHIA